MIDILNGDSQSVLKALPDQSTHCCVTSPPYFGLRDYGVEDQIGTEQTPEAYITKLVAVFREVRRVLRNDGTLWLNLGDSYRKDKQRLMIPARVALALQRDGWWLRDEIVWHKPRTTPSPVRDRTVAAHEMLYLLAKNPSYNFNYLAIEEPAAYAGVVRKAGKGLHAMQAADPNAARKRPGADREITVRETRRRRSVWSVSPSPCKEAHFATFPSRLIEPCVLAGSPVGGIVLDPFFGAGTTGLVARKHGRRCVGIEINPAYVEIAQRRLGLAAPVVEWD